MKQLRQLPFRPRLALAALYMVSLGLVLASMILALLANFTAGYLAGLAVEYILVIHLLRRA